MPVIARPTSNRRKLMLAALGLGLLALAVHTLFGEHGYLALRKQRQEIDRLESEIERLEKENERLAEEIRSLKTDPRAVERVAREELKMARPGEKVIMLPERAADSKADEEKKP
ncbi:MAG: FtsB family cell division protein [Candidatus Acidiferrales bacterium]